MGHEATASKSRFLKQPGQSAAMIQVEVGYLKVLNENSRLKIAKKLPARDRYFRYRRNRRRAGHRLRAFRGELHNPAEWFFLKGNKKKSLVKND